MSGATVECILDGEWISEPVTGALLEWDRCSELSGDRAALLVVESPDVAERVILKLAGGNGPFDVEEVARQAEEYNASGAVADSVLRLLRVMGQAPPFPVLRLAELRRWTGSEAHRELLEGRYPTREQLPPRSTDDVRVAPCDPATHLKLLSFISVQTDGFVAVTVPERVPRILTLDAGSQVTRLSDRPRAHGPPLPAVGQRPPPFLPAV